jgi:hypothetical protein
MSYAGSAADPLGDAALEARVLATSRRLAVAGGVVSFPVTRVGTTT